MIQKQDCDSCLHHFVCNKKPEYDAAVEAIEHVYVNIEDKREKPLSCMDVIVLVKCDHYLPPLGHRRDS